MKNQFRSLDEDEVEFLDSVLETTRAKEAAVKRETAEELDAFRRQQEEAEKAARTTGPEDAPESTESTSWSVGKKRKKGREGLLGGVKLRKASSGEKTSVAAESEVAMPALPFKDESAKVVKEAKSDPKKDNPAVKPTGPTKSTAPLGLGLAAYSSDEDD